MVKTIVQVEGMMCGHCEAHVNDTVRREFAVKKVTSSHKKGQTVITSEQPLDTEKLTAAINATGYRVLGVQQEN